LTRNITLNFFGLLSLIQHLWWSVTNPRNARCYKRHKKKKTERVLYLSPTSRRSWIPWKVHLCRLCFPFLCQLLFWSHSKIIANMYIPTSLWGYSSKKASWRYSFLISC